MYMLDESEARKLAVVFEETAAYDREQQRNLDRQSGKGSMGPGWEEVMTIEDEEPPDYWQRPDITEGAPYEE